MKGRGTAALLALGLLGGPLAASAAGQQRIEPAPDGGRDIDQVVVDVSDTAAYIREAWEGRGVQFPVLTDDAVVVISEDAKQLKFIVGNELGVFHPAPEGGSAFFGQGRPIFGIAAPPILPSRILRPLGTGDAGDRFLGAPPPISEDTVIPRIGQTFDDSRQSFAFLDGPPQILDTDTGGSPAFPSPETVASDTNGPIPDNVPIADDPTPPTTTPGTPDTRPIPPATLPGPRPTVPRTVVPPTIPAPGTTVPRTTTTRPRSTTTTTRPRSTTTSTPTSSTSTTTTSTTRPTTTTITTPVTVPVPDPVVERPVSFVLGNQRDAAGFCLSNATGGTSNPGCDRLFDLSGIRPGVPHQVNLTLWNVDPDSELDAVDLRVFAGGCTSGTNGPAPHGSGNLCDGLQLKILRYSTAARSGAPSQCVYGCTTNYGGSLNQFVAAHGTAPNGKVITTSFARNEKAYLVLSVLLPDTGASDRGRGNDNRYQARTANLKLTWQMTSA